MPRKDGLDRAAHIKHGKDWEKLAKTLLKEMRKMLLRGEREREVLCQRRQRSCSR